MGAEAGIKPKVRINVLPNGALKKLYLLVEIFARGFNVWVIRRLLVAWVSVCPIPWLVASGFIGPFVCATVSTRRSLALVFRHRQHGLEQCR